MELQQRLAALEQEVTELRDRLKATDYQKSARGKVLKMASAYALMKTQRTYVTKDGTTVRVMLSDHQSSIDLYADNLLRAAEEMMLEDTIAGTLMV